MVIFHSYVRLPEGIGVSTVLTCFDHGLKKGSPLKKTDGCHKSMEFSESRGV
jgi:hypothetical protein